MRSVWLEGVDGMTFDKYKQPDGTWLDEEGTSWDARDWLSIKVLDFCGCGHVERNLEFVRDGLKLIQKRSAYLSSIEKVTDVVMAELKRMEEEVFGTQAAAEFFYQVAAARNLTEHGGSVPGWLDEAGENFIKDVDELLL